MWYEMFWDRKEKFGGKGIHGETVYVLNYKTQEILKGKVGNFCGTLAVFHVWCEEIEEEWKDVIVGWNDIEPLTDEGYNVLAEKLKSLKENEE